MADLILMAVERGIGGEGRIEDYENGREHGYVLTDEQSGAAVTFSENRNSDEAVVYEVDWNNSTDSERDAAYHAKKFYPTAAGAAAAIIKLFRNKRGQAVEKAVAR